MAKDHGDPWQLMEGLFQEIESYQTRLAAGIVKINAAMPSPALTIPDELTVLDTETTRHSRYLRLVCGPRNQP